MSLTTYNELQAGIADWLDRPRLTTVIPDFIALCESRLRRTIKTKHTSVLQLTLSSGASSLSLPANIADIVSIAISGSTKGSAVQLVPHGVLLAYRVLYTTAALPLFCAIVGTTVEFAPLPDANYTIDVEIEGPFVPLSTGAPTNWILTDYPDVYLYGSLVESAGYMTDSGRVAMWAERFRLAMEELAQARERWQFPGPLNRRPSRCFG